MEYVVNVVQPMMELTAPYARFQVAQSLADLCDVAHQTEDWFYRGSTPGDSFDEVIHVLFDDMAHFPDPEVVVGAVFFPGQEASRAAALAKALSEVIERYPGPDSRGVAHEKQWVVVRELAASLLAEMVRNGRTDWPRD